MDEALPAQGALVQPWPAPVVVGWGCLIWCDPPGPRPSPRGPPWNILMLKFFMAHFRLWLKSIGSDLLESPDSSLVGRRFAHQRFADSRESIRRKRPIFEALGQIRANRVFSPIRIEICVIRVMIIRGVLSQGGTGLDTYQICIQARFDTYQNSLFDKENTERERDP